MTLKGTDLWFKGGLPNKLKALWALHALARRRKCGELPVPAATRPTNIRKYS
jgi:hypothetical protein